MPSLFETHTVSTVGAPYIPAAPPQTPPQTPPEPRRSGPPRLADRTHRHRYQIRPWLVLFLPVGMVASHLIPKNGPTVAVAVLGGLAAWKGLRAFRRATVPAHRVYAALCTAAAAGWVLYAARFGVLDASMDGHPPFLHPHAPAGPGRWTLLTFLAGWAPLAWLWWEQHRVRARPEPAPEPAAVHPFINEWNLRVQPVFHWRLTDPEDVLAGAAFKCRLLPGQAIEDAEQARRKIASLLGISRKRLLFETLPGDEPGDTEDESLIRLLLAEPQNPQHEERPWQGPTHDPSTGTYRHGVYPDGARVVARLYQTERGRPIRACNSLHSGVVGSGKSRGVALKVLEHLQSGLFVVWFADGQGGVSIPELMDPAIDACDWPCSTREERMRMLRAAYKVMLARARKQSTKVWYDSHGNKRVGLGHWEATPEEPFIQIIIDEAQEDLRDPHAVKLVKALERMGNKVGMGVDLLTQVPLLVELGGASGDGGAQVLRGMAKAGNVLVYRAEDSTTGMVTITQGVKVDPQALPAVPGMCYLIGHSLRTAPCRTYYVSEDNLGQWLRQTPKVTLDGFSARAAGEDYATRFERRDEHVDGVGDLEDLDLELAIVLGERIPGQDAPGMALEKLTIKQEIFNIVKAAGGPIKREQIITGLAERHVKASTSSVNQALTWWCERGHLESVAGQHGYYDLINREGEEQPAGPEGD
jgi:hypothetical protein